MKGIPVSGKVTRYLWVASVVSLIVIFLGLLYYLETGKKERYFNQLYFRQIDELSREFETNLVRLRTFTRVTKEFISETFDPPTGVPVDGQDDVLIPTGMADNTTYGRKKSADNVNVTSDAAPIYQSFIETQINLDNYLASLTEADLIDLARDEINGKYKYLKSDLDREFKKGLKQKLMCAGSELKSELASKDLYEDYCAALNSIISVLGELPSYAEMDVENINKDEIEKIPSLVAKITSLQDLPQKYRDDSSINELKKRKDAVEFLSGLLGGDTRDGGVGKTYADYCRRYFDTNEYISDPTLRLRLSEYFENEDCADREWSLPDKKLSRLYKNEKDHQLERISEILSNLFFKEFILLIAEYISPLLRDLQQLEDIARNIELANSDQPKSKKHEGEENISRKTLELERDKTKYMQVGGPVDTSASQHDLGLKYVEMKCENEAVISLHNNCEEALIIGPSKKTNPYTTSNLIVTSHLTDSYAFIAPIANLLPKNMEGFDSVLISTEEGSVVVQNDSLRSSSNQHFIGIQEILARAYKSAGGLLMEEECKDDEPGCIMTRDERKLKRSTYVDEEIGGVPFRIYIRPYKVGQVSIYIDGMDNSQSTLYFVGLKSLQDLRAQKLKISPGVSMVLFSIVVSIILAFVFLKIVLAHPEASFTRSEGLITVFAVIIFVSLSTIGIATLGLWDKINREMEGDANKVIEEIQQRFNGEVKSYFKFMDYLMTNKEVVSALEKPPDTSKKTDSKEQVKRSSEVPHPQTPLLASFFVMDIKDHLLDFSPITQIKDGVKHYKYGSVPYISEDSNRPLGIFETNPVSPIDNVLMLDKKGRLTGGLIRGTRNLVSSPPKDLSSRKYFMRALDGDVWEMRYKCSKDIMLSLCLSAPESSTAQKEIVVPVFIERIFNIIDGARITQFAMPVQYYSRNEHINNGMSYMYDAKELYKYSSDKPKVLSFGASLHTFKGLILPGGLKFAVVENGSGQVVYHSDDNRSLIENFLQETENNPQLESLIRVSQGAGKYTGRASGAIESFTGVYRGVDTVFFADKLHKDIPWTLVVYKQAEEEQLLVTLLFSISIIIALATIVLIAIILLYLPLKYSGLFHWIWPQIQKSRSYTTIAIASVPALLLIYPLYSVFDNILVLILVITVTTLLIFKGINLFISNDRFDIENHMPSQEQHRRRYILMILSVLVISTAVPSLVICEKVSAELLHRASIYNIIKLNELRKESREVIDARIDRLCGVMATEHNDFSGCESIHEDLLTDLKKYSHIFRAVECNGDSERVFCLSKMTMSQDDHDKIEINTLLKRLDVMWDLPALLVALEDIKDLDFRLNEGETYHLNHMHPKLGSILFEHYWLILLVIFVWYSVREVVRFLAVRLLGIDVPRGYRTGDSDLYTSNWDDYIAGNLPAQRNSRIEYLRLFDALQADHPHYAILIRPTAGDIIAYMDRMRGESNADNAGVLQIDVLRYTSGKRYRGKIENKLDKVKKAVLVLENIESVAFDKKKRLEILGFIEGQMSGENERSMLIICDVAPLYMLTQQAQYIPVTMSEQYADSQEVIRWSRLLYKYKKYYGWSPLELNFNDSDPWENKILRELSVWPELYTLKPDLDQIKDEGKTIECAQQYITSHAGPLYRRRWSFCTKKEKLLLYQLSKGLMINPKNIEPLEHLLRRGFIRRDPGWSIANRSFSRFVRTAENESVYDEWVTASERGLWKILRIPLLTTVIVIMGILFYSAQEATETFLALATSVLALLPLLLRNLNLSSAGSSTPNET